MKIGIAKEDEGLTYFDLIKEMDKLKGKPMGKEAEITFFYWFVENFQPRERSRNNGDLGTSFFNWRMKNNDNYHSDMGAIMDRSLLSELNLKWFLKGQASKQYLDYEELQESRNAAKNAQIASIEANKKAATSIKLATVAIILGMVTGLIPLFVQKNYPQPPFDVKVIEDKTKVQELQNENNKLKEELYKAEMMVKVLEGSKN